MSRNKFALILALLVASTVDAQKTVGQRIPVTVSVASTAQGQLERAELLIQNANNETDDDRRTQLALTAFAQLDIVRVKWPRDVRAITDAAAMQADLAHEFQMPRNAIDALTEAVKRTPANIALERRLARAYAAVRDDARAEEHYRSAEALVKKGKGVDPAEADPALYEYAELLARKGRAREAAQRYLEAAELEGQRAPRAAQLALERFKELLRDTKDASRAEARRAATDLEAYIRKARQKGAPGDATTSAVEHEFARVRVKAGI